MEMEVSTAESVLLFPHQLTYFTKKEVDMVILILREHQTPAHWRTRSSSMHVQPMTSCIVCCACKLLGSRCVPLEGLGIWQLSIIVTEMFHRGRMMKVSLIKEKKERMQGPWVIL